MEKFLTDEHVAAVLDITRQPGEDGTIFVQSGGSYEKGKTIGFPRITLSVEHYGRMARLLAKKVPVEVEVNVEAQFYDDDDKAYDTLAEIPGADPKLKDQLVMLGGHMDSWHAGEGATDNGAGVAVAMEAVRLLKKLGVQPRRTIRVALWSGEEEGILGSRGYVKNHFGGRPEPTTPRDENVPSFMRRPTGPLELKPEQKLVSAYFNLDNGTGKVRGMYLQGNALGGAHLSEMDGTVPRSWHDHADHAQHRRHGPSLVRRGRHPGIPVHPGPDGLRHSDPSLEPGRLRAHPRRRSEAGRGDYGLLRLQRRHARRDVTAKADSSRRTTGEGGPRCGTAMMNDAAAFS